MKKILIAVIAVLAVMLASQSAYALVNFEVGGRYWYTNLDTEVNVTEAAIAGTDINLVEDVNLEEKKGFMEGSIKLGLGGHNLRYSYLPMSWEGQNVLQRKIQFSGKTYNVGGQASAELTINYHRFGYEYDIVDSLGSKFGLIFEVKYLEVEASLKEAITLTDESGAFRVPLPAVGVVAQAGIPGGFSIGGEVTGISLGTEAYFVDAEGAVNFSPAPFFIASVGYRYIGVHVEADNDMVDLKISGPFAHIKFVF